MAITDISYQPISQSYQGILQYSSSGDIFDGLGNPITNFNVSVPFATTASFALNVPVTASYAVTASFALNVPVTASYAVSASYSTTASFAKSTTVPGASNQIIYNSGSSLLSSNSLQFDDSLRSLSVGNGVSLGSNCVAMGRSTVATGSYSFVGGYGTIASGSYQTVLGQYNTTNNTSSLFVVGNGTSPASRSDAFKVTMSGSLIPGTVATVPSWAGQQGEMIFFQNGSIYRIYVFLNNGWRSASLS
jgi:hypothetical protein